MAGRQFAQLVKMARLDGRLESMKQELLSLSDDDYVAVLNASLQKRPELAFAVVSFACPTLTFPPLTAITENKYIGKIKSFNEQRQYGFISCKETEDLFGGDVFLHGSQYHNQQVGTQVSFAVFLNKDHKPQAFDVENPHPSKGGGGTSQQGVGSNPFFQGANVMTSTGAGPKPSAKPTSSWGKASSKGGNQAAARGSPYGAKNDKYDQYDQYGDAAMQLLAAAAAAVGGGQMNTKPGKGSAKGKGGANKEFQGVVRKFDEEVGRGFITCSEVKKMYGEDVYVHKSVLEPCGAEVGDSVAFKVHVSHDGKPQAKGPMRLVKKSQGESSDQQEYFGKIKSFVHKNGYGFVECEETYEKYGRDVWLGDRAATEGGCKEVGMDVIFQYHVSHEGNPVVDTISPQ